MTQVMVESVSQLQAQAQNAAILAVGVLGIAVIIAVMLLAKLFIKKH